MTPNSICLELLKEKINRLLLNSSSKYHIYLSFKKILRNDQSL